MTEAALVDLDLLDKETLKALLIRERRSNALEIEHLKLVIEKFRRMLFGVRSEKLSCELEQLELRLEELETSEAAEQAAEDKNTETQSASSPRLQDTPLFVQNLHVHALSHLGSFDSHRLHCSQQLSN